jgi:hypothetical protein
MKYREAIIAKTIGQFGAEISETILYAPTGRFPYDDCDLDGAFYSLSRGVENLRKRIANAAADQILDMLSQAKAHYEAGEYRLASDLMQDIKMAAMGRKPWAYPRELYRWHVSSSLPELSEADLLDKDDEGN